MIKSGGYLVWTTTAKTSKAVTNYCEVKSGYVYQTEQKYVKKITKLSLWNNSQEKVCEKFHKQKQDCEIIHKQRVCEKLHKKKDCEIIHEVQMYTNVQIYTNKQMYINVPMYTNSKIW